MPELVLLTQAEGVATLTLNRPDKLNAFADDMREALASALDRAAAQADIRVLVVTGAGRAFCAGGDIQHMVRLKERDASYQEFIPLLEAGREGITRLAALPIPVIAAVNGPAAGGGLNLALACDLRIASDQATFGETFVRLGLHADWGGTYFLPRLVGTSKALDLCWLGDMIDAAEALRIGLVNRVVPHARFAEEVATLAARLAAAPQASIRLVKQTLTASRHRSLAECLAAEIEAQRLCWETADVAEGTRAFVEKRTARFGEARPPLEATSSGGRRFE
ncbi:MAG TPA: enoyl-CoA hydratase-related protein [Candidatus Eisenbacteria bacterium]|jgi:2-(1,2-epoxy-1,2-dihydrophenyl)acetyl-CoA isomerase